MEEKRKNFIFHPIISSIQKIALYETKAVRSLVKLNLSFYSSTFTHLVFNFQRFYLIGSNNTQTRFRVLKIDRMEPRELELVDDKREYTQDEILDLVDMINMGNRTKGGRGSSGIATVSAFGIVGKK